ncbi:hypothetical protein SteCoe_30633 [Stentor coeruleus]|uniref:Uncharacterized protein n=1 Tax=Stentor coeruleus TaxID=5963 RepID=A0A1R2B3F1_9CILI|nr:hypothetical protein SteCoe_30633 [Stentor coeruleus]
MESNIERPKLPVIIISSVHSESKDANKSKLMEAEKEENQEKALAQVLLEEMNIEKYFEEGADPLIHNPTIPEDQCMHCNLMKKVMYLQSEINKMSTDINYTHEVLNMKRMQNAELKNAIKKLESSLLKTDGTVLEQKESTCSCGSSCSIC